jgi:Zn-finger nucleic acid-binding protein
MNADEELFFIGVDRCSSVVRLPYTVQWETMMPAQTLHCPSCGAAISSDSTSCQYCGARLQTVSCPACFGLAFAGSKFCPHCGHELAKPADVRTDLKCPRCRTSTMRGVALKETKLLECPDCCGLWVHTAVFNQICNSQKEQIEMMELQIPQPGDPRVDFHRMYLACPICTKMMNRLNFAHRSGVIIDVCKPDGIWFDRDEMRHIIEFIREGGMERARMIEKQELADQVRELEGLGNRLAPTSVFNEVNQGELANAIAFAGGMVGKFL